MEAARACSAVREEIDWGAVREEGVRGRLLPHLRAHVPPQRWGDRNGCGMTLLHYAAFFGDEAATAALLCQPGVDMDTCDFSRTSCAQYVAISGHVRVLLLLLAAGADGGRRHTLLERALVQGNGRSRECVRALLANGVRLRSVGTPHRGAIAPWMEALDRGVLACRAATLALLVVKRRRAVLMRTLDRFVVREIAVALWGTRTAREWEPDPPRVAPAVRECIAL